MFLKKLKIYNHIAYYRIVLDKPILICNYCKIIRSNCFKYNCHIIIGKVPLDKYAYVPNPYL